MTERERLAHQVLDSVGLRSSGTTAQDLRRLADMYRGVGLAGLFPAHAQACLTAAHILDGADPDTAAVLAALETQP